MLTVSEYDIHSHVKLLFQPIYSSGKKCAWVNYQQSLYMSYFKQVLYNH